MNVTIAEVAKNFPKGSLCWLVNADNNRHGDEVVVTGRPVRGSTKRIMFVPVKSLVDGWTYECRRESLVLRADVEADGATESMQRAQSELRVTLKRQAERLEQTLLGDEMVKPYRLAEEAAMEAAWDAAEPTVTKSVLTTEGLNATITIVGPTARCYNHFGGKGFMSTFSHEVEVFRGMVNWSAIGVTSVARARAYARAIAFAANIAAGSR